MKKFLLSGIALLSVVSGYAKNERLDNYQAVAVSPDGKYVVSTTQGGCMIRELASGKEWIYPNDNIHLYSTDGNANCLSATGILVGSTTSLGSACFWKDGEWTNLPVKDKNATNLANGISIDGTMICGSLGVGNPGDDVLAAVPVIWRLNDAGQYGEPEYLPHPDKDFTGRAPQYVTALCISEDKKTIAGQVRDYSGFFNYPILYTLGEDGTWSYNIVHPELLNPENLVFPEYPGDGPIMPSAESYMDAQEKAAYAEALEIWKENGEDYETYPDPADYLTGEHLIKFQEDYGEWLQKYTKWEAEMLEFFRIFNQCSANGATYIFNNLHMSANGKFLATTSDIIVDEEKDLTKLIPYVFNLEDNSYHKYNLKDADSGFMASTVINDGTLVIVADPYEISQSYLIEYGNSDIISLIDWIKPVSTETAEWMTKEMTHKMEIYNKADDNYTYVDLYSTGFAIATQDMKTIVTSCYSLWNSQDPEFISYVLTPYDPTSVNKLEADADFTAKAEYGGMIRTNAPADITVYDLTGKLVFAADGVRECRPALVSGIYVVKAVPSGEDTGIVKTIKVSF